MTTRSHLAIRHMVARDPHEAHRVATPLELWAIHIRACRPAAVNAAFLLGAALLIALAFVPFPWSVLGMSAIVALLVVSLKTDPA